MPDPIAPNPISPTCCTMMPPYISSRGGWLTFVCGASLWTSMRGLSNTAVRNKQRLHSTNGQQDKTKCGDVKCAHDSERGRVTKTMIQNVTNQEAKHRASHRAAESDQ